MTLIDASSKGRIKDALIAHLQAELDASISTVAAEHRAGELDQDSSFSADEQSQAYEAGDLEGLFESEAVGQRARMTQAEALDVSATSTVRPGAIVRFGGDHYVVGVVSSAFEAEGVTFEGISADSPVYAAIDGLAAGDTFTVNDRTHTLDLVL